MESFEDGNKPVSRAARGPALLVGRRRSWLVVAVALLLSVLALTLAPAPEGDGSTASNLPDDAESALAAQALASLPDAEQAPALAVYSRDDGALTSDDLAALQDRSAALGDLAAAAAPVSPPVSSETGDVALIAVPLDLSGGDEAVADQVAQVRAVAADGIPDGVTVEVTGGPAFGADLANVFEGADVRLLVVTALVVAVLLLVTYRSPWLWLVPLSVVGLGDRVASEVVATVSTVTPLRLDPSITGITSVLVFGAGTNYALLLIARYREELRRHEDRHEAMRRAVSAAAPAILASSGTVVLSLLALTLADAPFVENIGYAGAVGIALAVSFGLLVLPSAMVLPGRWLFWPFVPRTDQPDPADDGWWARLGRRVTAHPVRVGVVVTAVLLLMCAPLLGLRTGLAQTDQFRATPESVTGQQTLQAAFPAGTGEPLRVATTPGDAEAVVDAVSGLDGVAAAEVGESTDDVAEISVTLTDGVGTTGAQDAVGQVRTAASDVDPQVLVGGSAAEDVDERAAASRDRAVVIPVVLVIVLGLLLMVLRSPVAAGVLATTVVLSYGSALGVGWLVFDLWWGFPAMDLSVPLLTFLFLVALGVDYNIFLSTRAREERDRLGDTRQAIVSALARTGGVITSAGILLAAVFAVLGVLPLIVLTQVGVIVGFGVLLDTTVVRSVLVPALVARLGDRFWWPGPTPPGRHRA